MSPAKLLGLARGSKKLASVFRPSTSVKPPHYLDRESTLGAQIFGTVPAGVDRKFFHSTQKNVWIWHENGTTVRYEVHPHGVFKRIGAQPFKQLSGTELANFRTATRQYLTTIKTHLYFSTPHKN